MTALTVSQDLPSFPMPTTWAEYKEYAQIICKSSFCPANFKGNWENVLLAMQFGKELGLQPLQALQNIAVIGSRPTLWGDAVMALIRCHPEFEDIEEKIEGEGEALTAYCTITRRGQTPVIGKFSRADARQAGLLTKDIWIKYEKPMLKNRARGFAARDGWQDVLKGLWVREEAEDIPEEKEVKNNSKKINNPIEGTIYTIPEEEWDKLVDSSAYGTTALKIAWEALPHNAKQYIATNRKEEWKTLKVVAAKNDEAEILVNSENEVEKDLAEHSEWLQENEGEEAEEGENVQ